MSFLLRQRVSLSHFTNRWKFIISFRDGKYKKHFAMIWITQVVEKESVKVDTVDRNRQFNEKNNYESTRQTENEKILKV